MTGKTHVACGALSAIALTAAMGLTVNIGNVVAVPALSILLSATGSLIPDIDMPHSKMGHKHPVISSWFKHRGMTHTLIFPAVLFLLCVISTGMVNKVLATIVFNLVFPLMFGWIIHIWADLFNKKGVPLLFPITSKHIHIASVLTNSWQEGAFLFLYFLATLGVLYWKLAQYL